MTRLGFHCCDSGVIREVKDHAPKVPAKPVKLSP
jgi:hypothetical protein